MEIIILSIHLVVCIALIGLVLLQRSEGGALGIGGGGGGALMSGRGAADALAKMTYFAGGLFLIISLLLTVISGAARNNTGGSVFDNLPSFSPPAITQPETPAPAEPTTPDPTQSSLPAQTQLAAAPEAVQPTTLGPAPAAAGERAGPLTNQPATTSRLTPQQTAARSPSTQEAAATRPAATPPTTVQRTPSTGGTTQNTATTTTPARTPLRLPGGDQAAAALNTVPLDAAQTPESSEDNPLAAVRRERAGPDQ